MEKRGETDYEGSAIVTEDEIKYLLPKTEEFIDTIKKLIV